MQTDIVIIDAARTPIGKFGGTLRKQPPADLGNTAVRALLALTGILGNIVDQVVLETFIKRRRAIITHAVRRAQWRHHTASWRAGRHRRGAETMTGVHMRELVYLTETRCL